MSESQKQKKLWCILASLALAVAIAIVLDALPQPSMGVEQLSAAPSDTTAAVLSAETETETELETDETSWSQTDSAVLAGVDLSALTETTASDVPATASPETTSAEAETALPPDDGVVTLTFLGACAPGSPLGTASYGSLNSAAEKEGNGYFFKKLQKYLAADDLTLAANTCLFTDVDAATASLSCAAPRSGASVYADGSIEFVSLASPENRAAGKDISAESAEALAEAGVQAAAADAVSYFDLKGLTVAVLTTELVKNGNLYTDIAAVREAAKKADFTVVYFWTAENDSHTPPEWLTYSVRRLAMEGASLLVGCGSSELLPVEEYEGATIVYSLGNLLDGTGVATDNTAALLRLTLSRGEDGALVQSSSIIPCYSYKQPWQPCEIPSDNDDYVKVTGLLGTDVSSAS